MLTYIACWVVGEMAMFLMFNIYVIQNRNNPEQGQRFAIMAKLLFLGLGLILWNAQDYLIKGGF